MLAGQLDYKTGIDWRFVSVGTLIGEGAAGLSTPHFHGTWRMKVRV